MMTKYRRSDALSRSGVRL